MNSNLKANSIVTQEVLESAGTFEVSLTLPRVIMYHVLDTADIPLALDRVHVNNLAYAVIHGLGQRVPDSAAIGLADKTGAIIPKGERLARKAERMQDVCTHLESGSPEWNRRTAARGDAEPALVIAAFARVKSCTIAEAETRIQAHAELVHGGDRRKMLADLRKARDIRAAILAIQTERLETMTPAVDVEAMVDEM